jgi:hypothetical protein
MTAIVLIGRVGARITAELGTMQVSEQIDALLLAGARPGAHAGGAAHRRRDPGGAGAGGHVPTWPGDERG